MYKKMFLLSLSFIVFLTSICISKPTYANTDNTVGINEIEQNNSLEITDLKLKNSNNKNKYYLSPLEELNIQATVYNNSHTDTTATLIIALYSPEGKIIELKILSQLTIQDFNINFRTPKNVNDYQLKVFFGMTFKVLSPLPK